MKYFVSICCLFLFIYATAQSNKKEDIYPVPSFINVKPPNNKYGGDPSTPKFDECVDGNCENGTGIRLKLDKLASESYPYSAYYLYFTLLKGEFSNGGKTFNGKVYRPRLRFRVKDEKVKQLVRLQANITTLLMIP